MEIKRIYLINSPQNYISLIEYLNEKNIGDKNIKIFTGFVSRNSFKQILKIHKSNIGITNELIFLQKVFGENKEKLLIFLLSIININKFFCVVGDKKSLLFRLIYQGCKKTVFLDDGLNLLTFTDKDIKIKEYELFSYFDLKTKKLVKNKFTYLRKKTLINNIDNNCIWLLGTPAANFEIIEYDNYKKIINLFASMFKDKKILFFPHRDEIVDNASFLNNVIVKKNITEPIEIYATKQKTMFACQKWCAAEANEDFDLPLKHRRYKNVSSGCEFQGSTGKENCVLRVTCKPAKKQGFGGANFGYKAVVKTLGARVSKNAVVFMGNSHNISGKGVSMDSTGHRALVSKPLNLKDGGVISFWLKDGPDDGGAMCKWDYEKLRREHMEKQARKNAEEKRRSDCLSR